MRIEELYLRGVGLWANLAPAALVPGVNIVLGDNEAGKSTLMRAIDALFFGATEELVAPRRVATFDIGARLALPGGGRLVLERSGKKRGSSEPLEASLEALLDGRNSDRFRAVFRLDQQRVTGDEGALEHDTPLGSLLFAAATGIAPGDLAAAMKTLEDDIREHRSRAKGRSGFKKAASDLADRLAANKSLPRIELVESQHQAVLAASAEVARLLEQQATSKMAVDELTRWREGLTHLAALRQAEEELERLHEAGLPRALGWLEGLRKAFDRLRDSEPRVENARAAAEDAERALSLLPEPGPLAALAAETTEVVHRLGGLERDRSDERTLRANVRETADSLRALLGELGKRPEDEQLRAVGESLVAPPPLRRKLAGLLEQVDSADDVETLARRNLAELRTEEEAAARKVADRIDEPTEPLEQAIRLLEGAEAAAQGARKARGDEVEERAAGEKLAVDLGLGSRALAEHAALAIPEPESRTRELEAVQRAHAESEAAKTERTRVAAEVGTLEAETTKSAGELGAAPVREVLDEARGAREQAWLAVRGRWSELPLPREALEREAQAFERATAEADRIADARYAVAERLGKHEALVVRLADARERSDRARAAEASANEVLARRERAWTALWPFMPAPPAAPDGWIPKFERLRERHAAAEKHATEASDLERRARDLRSDATTLIAPMLPEYAGVTDAATLQRAAEAALSDRVDHRKLTETLRTELRTLRERREKAETSLARKSDDVRAWTARWNEETRELPDGLPRDRDGLRHALDQQKNLETILGELRKHDRTLTERTASVAAQEQQIRELVARAAAADPVVASLGRLEPPKALEELEKLTTPAGVLHQAVETARTKATDARTLLANETRLHEARRHDLAERWKEASFAGEPTPDAVERALADGAEARQVGSELAMARSRLEGRWTEGLDVAVAAIGGRSEGELADALEQAKAEAARVEADLDAAKRQRTTAENERHRLCGDQTATIIEQQLADARSQVLVDATDLAFLELAKILLERAQKRSEDEAAPLVERASSLFARLTRGEYSGLALEHDGTRPKLIALDASARGKEAAELSTGTCDQMWLSLRLAVALEAAKETPFPLLLDDVLVQFDDGRSAATLEVLGEVAEQVQVLLFTHHDHVVDLGRQALGDALGVVTLPAPNGGARDRLIAEERDRHPRPEAPEAARDDELASARSAGRPTAGRSDAEDLLLEILRSAAEPLGKNAILDRAGDRRELVDSAWSATIDALKQSGRIAQEGERRGARYRVPRDGDGAE